jgi:hypothetical protein
MGRLVKPLAHSSIFSGELVMYLLLILIAILLFYLSHYFVCGITKNGVIGYCNTIPYDSLSYLNGHYTGKKWECVEFIRRYYQQIFGLTFPSIKNAYALMDLTSMKSLDNSSSSRCTFHKKGKPQLHDILVFEHEQHGHTAIVVKVLKGLVRIAEQNWGFWKADYSREISLDDPTLLGWLRVKLPRRQTL